MFSLPIPSRDREQFADLQHGDIDIASVVNGITNGRMSRRRRVHLDPDLNFDAYRYRKDRPDWQQWRGMLGQAGIAQSHLNKQGVGSGDVFLFFGLYRQVEETPKAGASSEEHLSCTSCGAGSRSTRSIGSPTSGQMTSPGHAIIPTSWEATATTGTPSTRRRQSSN